MTPALQAHLDEHIPYRLTAVDCSRWACELLLSGKDPKRIALSLDETPVITSNSYRLFTNPMVEMGAIYCRVLLELLGLCLDASGTTLQPIRKRRPDDVGVERFGLSALTVDDIRSAAPGLEAERACVVTIHMAHKAVAHLTTGRQPDDDLKRLYLCSNLVPRLVVKHLYLALGRPEPKYRLEHAG